MMGVTYEEATGSTTPVEKKTVTYEEASDNAPSEKAPEDMTWGETAEDTVKALGAGAARGTAALAGLPGDAFNAGMWLAWKANKVFDEDAPEPDWESTPLTSSDTTGALSDVTGGATDYRGKTKPAKYAGTVGEFAPGIVGGGGSLAKKVATNVLAPALASEGAAQLTEGTEIGKKYEPYIRVGAAILGSGAAHALPKGQAGAEIAAGKKILGDATNPDVVIDAATNKAKEILPGSLPNLAEASGDVGIAQATKRAASLSPNMRAAQTDIQGQSNAARSKAISEIAPDNADHMAATTELKGKVSSIETSGEAKRIAAERQLKKRMSALPPERQPEELGAAIREGIVSKKTADKSVISGMYNEVDPSNSLVVVTDPIKKAADDISSKISVVAKPIDGEEAAIFEMAKKYSPTDKFSSLIDFRKRINDEIARLKRSGEGGQSIPRLNELRSSVESSINDAFTNQQTWKTPKGYAGMQPNMTPGAANRLRDANAAFREYAGTYRQGPMKDVLASTGYGFKKAESAIPQKAFSPGQTGGQTTGAFIKAAGATPEAISAIKEAAMLPLRSMMKGAEYVDDKMLASWKTKYKHSLDEISKHDPAFVKGVEDAVKSNTRMMNIAESTKTAIDNATVGKAKAILGAADNDAVRNTVTNALMSKGGSKEISEILSSVAHSPEAVNGIKAAGIKGIVDRASNAGMSGGERVISGAKLRKIVRENSDAIKALYGQDGMDRFTAIADDLERTEIAASNAAVRGGSDTASLLGPGVKEGLKKSAFTSIGQFLSGMSYNAGALGHLGTAAGAAASAIVANAIGKMRNAGITRINDIYERALLDPKLAAAIMKKATKNKGVDKPALDAALNALLATHSSGIRDHYKSGGRVGIDHEAEADRLISAAMSAHKNMTKSTEHLLHQPDDAIIKALSIANEEI